MTDNQETEQYWESVSDLQEWSNESEYNEVPDYGWDD